MQDQIAQGGCFSSGQSAEIACIDAKKKNVMLVGTKMSTYKKRKRASYWI